MKPIQLLEQANTIWQGEDIDLHALLDNYRVDAAELPLLTDQLDDCDNGVFLLDKSGLAPHLLGLNLIKRWQAGDILQQYNTIIWLPVTQLLKLPVQPVSEDSLDELVQLSDPEAHVDVDRQKNVVVITGIDALSARNFTDQVYGNCLAKWLELIKGLPCLAVGNYRPELFGYLANEIAIALPPLYMNLVYNQVENDAEERLSLPGSLLVDEVAEQTSRQFRFDNEDPNGVFSLDMATVRQYFQGERDIVPEQHEEVQHLSPLLTLPHVIEVLAGQKPADLDVEGISMLDTAAKWYYAALSAEKAHVSGERRCFFLYQVAGHLLARQAQNHYITDLGPIEDYMPQASELGGAHPDAEIREILLLVTQQEAFQMLDGSTIANALKAAKKAWREAATEARNKELAAEGKPAMRGLVGLSKATFKSFNKLNRLLCSNVSDIEVKRGIHQLPKEEQGPSYQAMQGWLNEIGATDIQICQQVLAVLTNQPIKAGYESLIGMLTANLLSESVRNVRTFFAPFAMLNLSMVGKKGWDRFAALPERVAIDVPSATWDQLILADCLDVLGGKHPMAYNGSFNHTRLGVQNGVDFPAVKTQLLYLQWLKAMLPVRGISIETRSCKIGFSPRAGFAVLDATSRPRMMCHLNVLLRVDAAYKGYGDLHILSHYKQPFQSARHQLADPRQLDIVSCGANGRFGYFLKASREVAGEAEDHLMHLKPRQVLALAMKFDAVKDNEKALLLYDYLCDSHPKLLAARYTRVLCLAFHPDILNNESLREKAVSDLRFLRSVISETGHTFSTELHYVRTVYRSRIWGGEVTRYKHVPRYFEIANDCVKLAKQYEQWDEETPILYLAAATLFNKAYLAFSTTESPMHYMQGVLESGTMFPHSPLAEDYQHNVRVCGEAEICMIKYGVFFVLSVFKDGPIYSASETIFQSLIRNTYCSAWILSSIRQPASSPYQELTRPSAELVILQQVLLHWVAKFKVHTQDFAKQARKKIAYMESFHGMEHPEWVDKSALPRAMRRLSDNTTRVRAVLDDGHPALLFRIAFGLPNRLVDSWCAYHHMDVRPVADHKWGACLLIRMNMAYQSRSCYQPMLHPASFSQTEHVVIKPKGRPRYFNAFSALFIGFLQRLQQLDVVKVSRVSYDVYAKLTALPRIHLIGSSEIQGVLIEVPNSVAIRLLREWLRECDFSYRLETVKGHGRCVIVPHINIRSTDKNYRPAISNGDRLHPLFKKIKNGAHKKLAAFYWQPEKTPPSTQSVFKKAKQAFSLEKLARELVEEWEGKGADIPATARAVMEKSLAEYRRSPACTEFFQKIEQFGFTVHDVPGDGNCFFHAILDQLHHRMPGLIVQLTQVLGVAAVDHVLLRRLAIGSLIQLACEEDEFVCSQLGSIQRYLANSAKNGSWADGFLIACLCRVLCINLVLINSNHDNPTFIRGSGDAAIYLGYDVGRHFVSTRGEPGAALLAALPEAEEVAEPMNEGGIRIAYQMGDDVEDARVGLARR
jgi:hypothetical protein